MRGICVAMDAMQVIECGVVLRKYSPTASKLSFLGNNYEFTTDRRASAVVVSAEEYKNIKLERLRNRLAVGMEQADRGDFAEYSLDDLIAELDGEV